MAAVVLPCLIQCTTQDEEKLHPALQMLSSDKRREPDAAVRLLLVEALLLLCTTRPGRDILRAGGTYQIVRAVHLQEKDEKASLVYSFYS
jgi:hypothetical protein